MIINRDIHPERKIYYLGAVVIDLLKRLPSDEIDYFTAYQQLNDVEKVSKFLTEKWSSCEIQDMLPR